MDPQANIKRQRELATEILDLYGKDHRTIDALAAELADLVQALDKWRTIGGYDPYIKER